MNKGISFIGMLAVALIVLRLVGKIDWSWWWVLAPIWIPAVIVFVIMALAFWAAIK